MQGAVFKDQLENTYIYITYSAEVYKSDNIIYNSIAVESYCVKYN